jgi:hypothetical protein
MSRLAGHRGLDREAVRLLMNSLEGRAPRLSAAAAKRYPAATKALRQVGLLRRAGHDRTVASADDHDDTPILTSWSPAHGRYGYFGASAGWTDVPEEDLATWEIDLDRLFLTLTSRLTIPKRQQPLALVADHLWELGAARIGKRAHLTAILFGRRLRDPSMTTRVRVVLRNRPSTQRRLLLTSTKNPDSIGPFANVLIAGFDVLLANDSILALDPAVIALRLAAVAPESAESIKVVAGGREVHFMGRTFQFKGQRQREVVCYLHERYLDSELRVSSQEILEHLDFAPGTRIRDVFKDSPAWNKLLTEKSGMCGFCFD